MQLWRGFQMEMFSLNMRGQELCPTLTLALFWAGGGVENSRSTVQSKLLLQSIWRYHEFELVIMVWHIWALGECNWNISHSIFIFPLLSKVRWWKFACTLYRQIFVQSTCLNWGLKIQFLVILNAACSVCVFCLVGCSFFVVFCGVFLIAIFHLYLNSLIKRLIFFK